MSDVPAQRPVLASVQAASAELPAERLHALLLNGGGRPELNNFSHLEHLRRLVGVLEQAGVPRERIAVFSGDGADPAPDLAIRDGSVPSEFWLLPRASARVLRPPVELVDSKLDGFALAPATRAALNGWFTRAALALGAGDTLLLYVTDHGERGRAPDAESTITLWGEKLGVSELREQIARLSLQVKVVMVMSQCFSGGFAALALSDDSRNACGFFSTTSDRRAHGCYAEVSGRSGVGHSDRLLTALAAGHTLDSAQRETLVTDDSPDVPLGTAALYLEQQLGETAARLGQDLAAHADGLLSEALRAPATIESEIRTLDRIGQAYGFSSPRSLAELEGERASLAGLAEQLATYEKLWEEALDALRQENLNAFLAATPDQREALRTAPATGVDARRRTTEELGEALARFTATDRPRERRLRDLRWKADEAKAASYRAEVRLAVGLRLRNQLLELAGLQYLATTASDVERERYTQLAACEQLALSIPSEAAPAAAPDPFPTLAEEQRRLARVLPGWLGVRYRAPHASERRDAELPAGAVVVSDVLPKGPAAIAGLEPGDLLLGTPDGPFTERHAIREWTMQGTIEASQPLLVQRGDEKREVWIRLAAYPLELPALPGPPEIGSRAPPLELALVDGSPAPAPGRPQLLFFWATWCGYCKKALPELVAFEREHGVAVLAITDEAAEDVERFAREFAGSLPEHIASDRKRVHFRKYGVSGTPTFVLVDAAGTVRQVKTGYDAASGLGIDPSLVLGEAAP